MAADEGREALLAGIALSSALADLLFATASAAETLRCPNPHILRGIVEGAGDAAALARDVLEKARCELPH